MTVTEASGNFYYTIDARIELHGCTNIYLYMADTLRLEVAPQAHHVNLLAPSGFFHPKYIFHKGPFSVLQVSGLIFGVHTI